VVSLAVLSAQCLAQPRKLNKEVNNDWEAIFASVAGSAVSSLFGGGSKSQTLPAKFNRSPAKFRNRVEDVMVPDTRGLEKLPEESASVGTIQTLINRHEAMLNAIDADAGAAGSLSSGGIGRYNY
jgi:hypothetical protein